MLSETYTLEDVKAKLNNDFAFFDYANDDEFEEALISVSEDVKLLYLYPYISLTTYATIEAKDKLGYTLFDTYVYWAEVYSICYEFLRFKERTVGQLETASSSESLKVEGYSYQTSGGSGSTSQADFAKQEFWTMMLKYFKLAGYDMYGLERTCTIFGTSTAYNDSETVM